MKEISLCFGYEFISGFQLDYIHQSIPNAEIVNIPHSVKKMPLNGFSNEDYQGIFTYALDFELPSISYKNVLHFDGAMLQFDCYLNGVNLGHFISGFVPIDIPVDGIIKEGKNRLVICLDTKEDKDIPPFGGIVDYATFGGIYREVSLRQYPKEHAITSLYAIGKADGSLFVEAEIDGEEEPEFSLFDGERLLTTFKGKQGKIVQPKLYSPESPYLYILKAETSTDSFWTRLAFYDAEFKESGFYLNGKKRTLIGLNRHQIFPFIGMAAPAELQREDARLLKRMGVELVRTSHYPQHDAFLEECCKLGIFIIDEIPGWQHIGETDIWRANCMDFASKMVQKDRKHPSLLAYGVRIDESKDDDSLYQATNDIAHRLDPYRPTLGVRNFKDSHCLEDIYCYNDFSCESLSYGCDNSNWKGAKGKPKIISEFCGHTFPTKPYDPTDRKMEHALRHAKVLEDGLAQGNLSALIGWCAFDYATHSDFGNGDHICYHGVASAFRSFKPAAYLYASQGETPILYVASTMVTGDFDAAHLPPTPVFSNADYIELYKEGKFVKKYYPSKDYSHLKHPPFIIDDYIGETLYDPRFSRKEKKVLSEALSAYAAKGFSGISLKQKLAILLIAQSHRMNFSAIAELYNKFLSGWGKEGFYYEIKAYKGGACFASEKISASTSYHLEATCSKTELNNEKSYDCAVIYLRYLDQNNHVSQFFMDAFKVETTGPIECLSPSIASLQGGTAAIYVASQLVKKPTQALVKIILGENCIEIPFTVK